jgi:DNA/RNA-binding domain of Phe-tRNA-synthetase-like protein
VTLARGRVAPELAAEFEHLRIYWTSCEARSGRSPEPVRHRLREMSNRVSGQKAIQMRQEAVPNAYRVFFRQVGIDPDERRTPAEQIILDRLKDGGFRSRNLLDDAITIATYETGVPVIAFDADRVSPPLQLRLAAPGEAMGAATRPLSGGQIVIAADGRPVGVPFLDVDRDCGVSRRTRRMLLVAIGVAGVPDISIEEALWTVEEILSGT